MFDPFDRKFFDSRDQIYVLVDAAFFRNVYFKAGNKLDSDEYIEQLVKTISDSAYKCWNGFYGETGTKFVVRVFYFDSKPISSTIVHPLDGTNFDLSETKTFKFSCEVIAKLEERGDFTVSLGYSMGAKFELNEGVLEKVLAGAINISELDKRYFHFAVSQKNVDMMIGVKMISIAHSGKADRLILIAGDSDFAPAIRYAIDLGLNVTLNPLGRHVNRELINTGCEILTNICQSDKSMV